MVGSNSDWGVDREGLVGLMKAFPYTIHEAIADIIDNSIDANAKNITVEINHIQNQQYVLIKDDGDGIAAGAIDDVISIGKRRTYKLEDLGHFGVGLKTAGLSQAENVTIFSKIESAAMNTRRISVNWMKKSGKWDKVLHSSTDSAVVDHIMGKGYLPGEKGTTVLLENLHRFDAMREGENNDGHTIMSILPQLEAHLAMVFHRFLENPQHPRHFSLHFPAMSEKIQPLDPLNPRNIGGKYGTLIQSGHVDISYDDSSHKIPVRLGILSKENHVSDSGEHRKRMTDAVGSWSNAEGAYLYRNDRLVAHSDWFGIPEINKTAVGTLRRASIELDSSLDDFFGLDPAKSNYRLPLDVRIKLKEFMAEKRLWVTGEDKKAFSAKAQHRYRTEGKGVGGKRKVQSSKKGNREVPKPPSKHNDDGKSARGEDTPPMKPVEVVHANSALIKPVSLEDHSSLITPSLIGQEVHVEVNMAHPWYIPFKQALKRWLEDG
jgi:hypothetical protein